MILLEMRTVTITEKGQIVIPKQLRNNSFMEGSKVVILSYEDHLEIRPLKEIDKKFFPAFATEKVLARTWLTKEEDEAWKDL